MDMRVAAYAVIIDADDRILLAHWNEGRRAAWTLPGGGLEPGEDPEHAARREVREETGLPCGSRRAARHPLPRHPGGPRLTADATGPLHALRIVYRARITGGRLRNEIDGSTDRAEWFPLVERAGLQRVKLVDIALRMASATDRAGCRAAASARQSIGLRDVGDGRAVRRDEVVGVDEEAVAVGAGAHRDPLADDPLVGEDRPLVRAADRHDRAALVAGRGQRALPDRAAAAC